MTPDQLREAIADLKDTAALALADAIILAAQKCEEAAALELQLEMLEQLSLNRDTIQ